MGAYKGDPIPSELNKVGRQCRQWVEAVQRASARQ